MRDKAHQGGNGEIDDSVVMETFGESIWTPLCFATVFKIHLPMQTHMHTYMCTHTHNNMCTQMIIQPSSRLNRDNVNYLQVHAFNANSKHRIKFGFV